MSGAPRVLNYRRVGKPIGARYVGRPTKFGNPFTVGRDGTRADVIAKFEAHILAQPDLVQQIRNELRGKDLVCWCAPSPCHADVLLRIANSDG